MDGHSNTSSDAAPPPPPQGRGRPPPSPAGSPRESLRKQNSRNSSSLHSSMRSSGPPLRPKLIRRDSSSQASQSSFRARPRLNSNHSNYSRGLDQGLERSSLQRESSFYNRPESQVWYEEQPGDLQRDNSDANLLSASMDNEAVEDEAEAVSIVCTFVIMAFNNVFLSPL